MPANKYALLRYRIIDRCIRNKQRPFPSKEDLRTACEEALYGSAGEHISISTIDKDIWAMRNEGELAYYAPIKFSKDRGGYFYEDPDYTISELPLTEDDLGAIQSAARTLFQFKDIPLFKQFDTAIEKILDRMKIAAADDHKSEHDVLQFERSAHYSGSEYLADLFMAAKNDQWIEMQYQKFGTEQSQRVELAPYLLKEYGGRWYVIGLERIKQRFKTYSLDRINQVRLLPEHFSRLEDFSTADFFKHALGITVTGEKPIEVQLRFSERLTPYIRSQAIHSSQKVLSRDDEKGIVVSLKVLHTIELVSLILGFGDEVEVLSPDSLKTEVVKTLKSCLKKYR